MNYKGCGRIRLCFNFKVLSTHLPGGTEKTNEKLKTSQFQARDLNPGPSEYEQ
jgi:hypothetical protein